MLLATGNLRMRTMICGALHCPLSDPPRLFSVGAGRQNLEDFAYVQFDRRASGRQALVVSYIEIATGRLRVDVAYWTGAPIDVHWLPIAVLNDRRVNRGFEVHAAQGPIGAAGWKLDLVVVMNTYDRFLNRAVRVAAVRLAGCP